MQLFSQANTYHSFITTNMSMVMSLVHVAGTAVLIAVPVLLGVFDNVEVGTSLDHYAEKRWPILRDFIPWMPMPANTLVNLGYFITGLWWLYAMKQCSQERRKFIPAHDMYMSYAFSWMAILYAGVQTWRLLVNTHTSAVLDQWYTLPIFAWVTIWANHLLYDWNANRMIMTTLISCTSYLLTLLHCKGFELALAGHIIVAIVYGRRLVFVFNNKQVQSTFNKAMLSCAGFVVLKLLDHPLAEVHPVFNYITGHFLSKVSDFLQIYYTSEFFFLLTLLKNKRTH